jgi:phenylalanyl-tRNA synthetase beta chain
LHTFDYDKVRDHKIVVRRAKQNEKMKTLDGVERQLAPDKDRQLDSGICMISDGDGSRAVGIGGIMGGAETEISFSTKNVLIECAWFEPIAIRRAARFLKLHTEASTRFGRGADPEMAELASRRAAELILQLAGGELLSGVVDIYPGKRAPKKLRVTRAEILRVMGADVPDKEVEASLGALGFAPVRIDQNRGAEGSLLAAWECTQPSWRAEVEREIDLIEEIARIYGLDKFPPRLPAARQGAARLPHFEAETRLRERLIGLGYREILTIPHVAEERDALFRPVGISPARLSNPLSEEANVLRSSGLVTMAAALEWNLNHGQRNARLFEIGRRYSLKGSESVETRVLTIGATGEARDKNIYESAREFSFADLKGDLDFSFSGLKTAVLRYVRGHEGPLTESEIADVAASFQRVVVASLIDRAFDAARRYQARSIGVAGGVSANSRLRAELQERGARREIPTFLPSLALATDNAAMIAAAGLRRFRAGVTASMDLNADPALVL